MTSTLYPFPVLSQQEYAIFTLNQHVEPLSKTKAKMIYIGKIKSISGLGSVQLMDWPDTSSERKQFYFRLMNKSPSQVNNKWASLSFSGRGSPPDELADPTSERIQKWLQDHPLGLAYAPLKYVPKGAKILLMLR